jgi:hypothetical protein
MATELELAGRKLRSARQRLDAAMKTAERAATSAHRAGTPETVIAQGLGVNRMTVRRWLGKL